MPILPILSAPLLVPDDSFHLKNGVVLREERAGRELRGFRLYLRGRRTAVRFGPRLIQGAEPVVEVARTSSGIVYGTLWQIQSGATLTSGSFAFIGDRGRSYERPASRAVGHGPRVLLVGDGVSDGFVEDVVLYEAGRFRSVGPATKVHLEGSGRVTGWTLVDGRDRPYQPGLWTSGPLFRRYFVWRDGRRFPKGRGPDR